jgi:enoyl-CoA hydratase/carnithine racemase
MGTLQVDIADGIADITIEVPELQLLDADLLGDLWGLLDRLEGDETVRVATFRSADPDFFCMHADVDLLLDMEHSPEVPTTPNFGVVLFERLRALPFATIAAVDGIARGGGCELLCAMDVRIGTPRCVVGQPEIALGLLPAGGGTVRWARQLGRASALDFLLTGRDLDADELHAAGWLQAVVAPEELNGEVGRRARRISRMPRESVAAIKQVVDLALGPTDDALLAESRALARFLAAGVHVELMQRFRAAGGQTREGEVGHFQTIIDATLPD